MESPDGKCQNGMIVNRGKAPVQPWRCGSTLALLGCLAAGVFLIPGSLFAQDEARENYEAVLKEWKATYVEALRVWSDFRICEESEADALRDQYLELKEKGDKLQARTITAATVCLESSVTPDPDLIAFLKKVPLRYFAESRYEESARVGKALLKHEPDNFSLMYNTARSAFFGNDFDYSRELFEKWIALEGKLPEELQPMYDVLDTLDAQWKRELELRQHEDLTGQLPRVVFETNRGQVVIELFEDQAPDIVNNLIVLIENQTNPFFENLSFFFVLKHQFSVTGSKTEDGTQVVPLGMSTDAQKQVARGHFRGSVTLDVRELTSGGSVVVTACRFLQIPMPELGDTSLVIGRVVEGMEIIDQLQATHELNDTLETVPIEAVIPDRLKRAFVIRKPEGKEYKHIDTQSKQNQ